MPLLPLLLSLYPVSIDTSFPTPPFPTQLTLQTISPSSRKVPAPCPLVFSPPMQPVASHPWATSPASRIPSSISSLWHSFRRRLRTQCLAKQRWWSSVVVSRGCGQCGLAGDEGRRCESNYEWAVSEYAEAGLRFPLMQVFLRSRADGI